MIIVRTNREKHELLKMKDYKRMKKDAERYKTQLENCYEIKTMREFDELIKPEQFRSKFKYVRFRAKCENRMNRTKDLVGSWVGEYIAFTAIEKIINKISERL